MNGHGSGGGEAWRHRHLLDVDILTRSDLALVMTTAEQMAERRGAGETWEAGMSPDASTVRDAGDGAPLQGRTVATLFAEPSTRTRVSFELAARALGAGTVSLDALSSSLAKGELLVHTVRTLEALGADVLVVRHARSGAAHLAAAHFGGSVVNAGDGWHAHPTQALLDLYTLRERLGDERLRGAKLCIVGDVLHSRVARSGIWALTAWGIHVWLTGPAVFLRGFEGWARALPADRHLTVTGDLTEGLRDADAVMALRVQRERLEGAGAPSEAAYAARWGLTEARLQAGCPSAVVMHPGPVNEGVELPADVASGPRSLITRQVANGVAVRMAALALLAGSHAPAGQSHA